MAAGMDNGAKAHVVRQPELQPVALQSYVLAGQTVSQWR